MFLANNFDYRENLIKHLVTHATNAMGLLLIESDSNGPRPDGIFITYTITSPYIQLIFEDNLENSPFECVLSLTIHHDKSSLDALNLSEKYRKSFVTEKNIREFKQKNIVIVSANRSSKRDNLLSVDYERLAGFDLRLRLCDTFIDETAEKISSIQYKEEQT